MSAKYEDWSKEELVAKLRLLQPEDAGCPRNSDPRTNKRKTPETSLLASSPTRPTPISKKKRKTAQREFDHSKFSTRKVAFRVAYYGWPYNGFASQGNDAGVVTVEDVLLEALLRTKLIENPSGCDFSRCGRTDRGVSGLGQVVALKVRSALPKNHPDVLEYQKVPEAESTHEKSETEEGFPEASKGTTDISAMAATLDATEELHYVDMLNRVLPETIRVLAWAPVKKEFSARFNCKSRTYKYFLTKELLDIDLMKDAASRLVGEHDFRNFCKLDKSGGITTFSRRVVSLDIRPVAHFHASNLEDQLFELVLCGSAFLYHQVRCIMAVLFMVGQQHEKPDIVDRLLNVDEMPTKPIYDLADEIPLVLYDSEYKDTLDWRYTGTKDDPQNSVPTVTQVRSHLKEQWQKHAIKAALFREGMAILDGFKVPLPSPDLTSKDDLVVTTYSEAVAKVRESELPSQETHKGKNPTKDTPMERAWRVLDYQGRVVVGGGMSKSIGKSYVPIEKRARTELYVDKAAKFKEKNDEKKAARQRNGEKKRKTETR